ncbi:SMI1/KNR4 family protein [Escherichia coli]|nr:SMI1/KNR4 family protein [Escherichia coli]APK23666.1 SMI1 / KNR4 family protein [Escherichia coli]EAA4627552.1 SMI1 / KNR4 family protein [Escherichia coli]EET3366992.1 SMI1/KNR4 family protein [Escherichia coli]EFA4095602.1 SMI1/KNR4 family protein [Escherichia coli]EFD4402684.1 SMI1/KNR4 family protein [Escherichia coli]
MFNKIEKFMVKFLPIESDKKEQLLGELERLTGPLPDSYRNFLSYFGDNIMFDYIMSFKGIEPSPWADDKGFDDLDYFYGLSSSSGGYTIFEAINTYKYDFNMKLIPIAASAGGNQVCVCLEGKRKGEVWFWDHETDPVFNEDENVSGLTLIAYDLEDFIDRLVVEDDN